MKPREPKPPTEAEIARVLGVLEAAREPIERTELARFCEMKERAVRKAVQTLVLRGHPVITLNDGYRISRNRKEILAEMRSLRHRAREINKRADALELYLFPPRPGDESQGRLELV